MGYPVMTRYLPFRSVYTNAKKRPAFVCKESVLSDVSLKLSNNRGVLENLFCLTGFDVVKAKVFHILGIPIVVHPQRIP
jgi:hypothetical protein